MPSHHPHCGARGWRDQPKGANKSQQACSSSCGGGASFVSARCEFTANPRKKTGAHASRLFPSNHGHSRLSMRTALFSLPTCPVVERFSALLKTDLCRCFCDMRLRQCSARLPPTFRLLRCCPPPLPAPQTRQGRGRAPGKAPVCLLFQNMLCCCPPTTPHTC